MTGVEVRQASDQPPAWGTNFYASVVGNVFACLASTLLHPLVVLPVFIAQVTESLYAVALVPVIGAVAWFAAVPIGQVIADDPNRRYWLIGMGTLRAVLVAMLAFIAERSDDLSSGRLVVAFLIGLAAFAVAQGIVATMTSAATRRALTSTAPGPSFVVRRLLGGLAALVGALLIARVLSEDGPTFPSNFALIFVVAAICFAITVFFMSMSRLRDPGPETTGQSSRFVGAWASSSFRRFALFRLVLGGSALLDPFIALYAVQQLSASARTIGWLLALFILGGLISRPLWSAITERAGARVAFQLMAIARMVVGILALAVPQLIKTDLWTERVDAGQAAALTFGASLFFVGATQTGLRAVGTDYVTQIAPAEQPNGFLAAARFVATVAALSPLLGAWIIDRTGEYRDAFLVATGFSLVAVLLSGLLTQSVIRPRPVAGAWRLRRTMPSNNVEPV